MNNIAKIAVLAAPLAVVAYATLSKNATLEHLYAEYPNLDPTIAKKAYRRMMSEALRGKLDTSNWSKEQFDQRFMTTYADVIAENDL